MKIEVSQFEIYPTATFSTNSVIREHNCPFDKYPVHLKKNSKKIGPTLQLLFEEYCFF